MTRVEWLDGMSVGVPDMDADHKEMFGRLNAVHDAMAAGNRDEALELCNALRNLAMEHGKREVDLLEQIGFPAIHNVLMVQSNTIEGINELTALIEAGEKAETVMKKVTSMQKAFIDYMLRGDINYKSYAQEKKLDRDPGGAK